jgi:hypothetical protein
MKREKKISQQCSTARADDEAPPTVAGEQHLLNRGLVDRREFEAMRLLAGVDVGVLGFGGAVLLADNRRDFVELRQVLRLVKVPDLDACSR